MNEALSVRRQTKQIPGGWAPDELWQATRGEVARNGKWNLKAREGKEE